MLSSPRLKGSAGAAAITSFLGPIADRYTMLNPLIFVSGVGPKLTNQSIAARNVNQWVPVNPNVFSGAGPNAPSVALGSMTTAPDGTNTAQHITEAVLGGVSSQHWLSSGFRMSGNAGGYAIRLAVFVKAAERTRCKLVLLDVNSSSTQSTGCQTVFDLAGGQIAVANSQFNSLPGFGALPHISWIAGPASITPFGNGWYLCMMDAIVPFANSLTQANGFTGMRAEIYIDAGSGTAAENTTYVGDGSSGLFVWNASALPVRAWNMSGVTQFFDDFTDPTMANIDRNNTQNPGYDWYPNVITPFAGFRVVDGVHVTAAADITQSGSVLTIASTFVNSCNAQMTTAVYNGAGGWTSKPNTVFTPPVLLESNYRWDVVNTLISGNGEPTFWHLTLEALMDIAGPATTKQSMGVDTVEPGFSIPFGVGGNVQWFTPNTQVNVQPTPIVSNGIPKWISTWTYDNSSFPFVYDPVDGNFYTSIANSNTGNVPHSSPAFWQLTTFNPASGVNTPGAINIIDLTQFHAYGRIWLPQTNTEVGLWLAWFDGVYVTGIGGTINGNGSGVYTQAFGGVISGLNAVDPQIDVRTYQIFYGGVSANPVHIDWTRITK